MKEFIKQIDERIKHLQTNPTDVNIGKVAELTLVKLRIKQLAAQQISPCNFYVVERNHEDHLDQLSIGFRAVEDAKAFRDSDYHKRKNPNAFIVCTINED